MVQMEDSFDSSIYSGDNFSSCHNDSAPNPAFQYPLPIFLFLFFIIGLPWNALVIGIILKKNLFTRPSVMLMLNLAISNFLTCLLAMPFHLVVSLLAKSISYRDRSMADDFMIFNKICQASFLYVWFQLVSVFTVAMMSLDRVIYLKKPLTYEGIITPWRLLVAILVVWIVSMGVSLLGAGRYRYHPVFTICAFGGDIVHFEILVLLFALGALIQLFGCGCIIYITRKHLLRNLRRALGNNIQTPNTRSDILRSYNKSQLQLVKVFGAIVTVSLLTAFLAVVGGVFSTYARITSETAINIYHTIAIIFVFSKPVLHPIMESYMTHEIRSVISKSCRSCFARIRSHRPCPCRDVTTVSVSPGRAEAGIVDIPAMNLPD